MRSVDEYVVMLLDEPHKKMLQMLESYASKLESFKKERPTELSGFKAHMAKLNGFRQAIESVKFSLTLDVIQAAIINDISNEQDKWLQSEEKAYEEVDAQVQALKEQIENENKLHNSSVINDNKQGNMSYDVLESKRKILESYSDKIFDICSQYGITTSDVGVTEELFTSEELGKLYDEYISYMQKEEKGGTNIVTRFRNIVSDEIMQGVVLIVLLVLCFTPILDFVSLGFFGLLAYNQMSNVKRSKYYSILMAITFNIKPENMGYIALDTTELLPEELTDEMIDNDERFAIFESMYKEVAEKLEQSNPAVITSRVMADWSSKQSELTTKLKALEKEYNDTCQGIKDSIDEEINFMNSEYERLKSEFKFLGDRYSQHLTYSGKYIVGLHDDCIEEVVDVGQRNIIIRPNRDTKKMAQFLQCIYVNAISNVLPGKLSVIVYDPNDFGRSVMPLYRSDLKDNFEIHNDGLANILESLTEYCQNNFKEMSGKTIDEYNAICEEKGMTPIEYKFLMLLSQPKTVEEDEKLSSFFEYSATGGVFICIVSEEMTSKEAYIFNTPFQGAQNPITNVITDEWCSKVSLNYIDAIKAAKPKGLPWQDFIENVWPTSKTWEGDATSFIDFYPGYHEGDPSLYKPYTLGNEGNVHAIGVGTSGAGKSVFLNHLIGTMCRKYSPWQLELWLCDFKGVEFQAYMNTEDHPYALPHIAACLCTSDGDYATSLFHAFRTKADRRYEDMKFIGVKNMPGWNKKVPQLIGQHKPEAMITLHTKDYKETDFNPVWSEKDIWTRVLFINDEFQVIFQKADPKNVEKIKADITQIAKVARACGMHIFFTSQSMKGTVSADILANFTLRFALRCEPEVSQDIIGSHRASDIKEKNGYLIVKSLEMKTPEEQKRYKTPFLNDGPGSGKTTDSELYDNIKYLNDLAIERGFVRENVITYEEATKHPISQMTDLYKELNEQNKLPDSGVFFLGPRMAYSENKAPDNIILSAKNNANIMACCSDYTDFVLFFNQLVTNINSNKVPGSIIINSQVADLAYITDAESYITHPDMHGKLLSEKNSCSSVITWIQNLLNARKESGKKDVPVWIFLLGWDKGSGFAVDPDITLRGKINTLLQTCGEYHIHVIFINTGMTGVNASTIGACSYKIAAKCSIDDSNSLIGSKQAGVNYDMATGWIFSNHDGVTTRDKLYISEVTREIASSEIVM